MARWPARLNACSQPPQTELSYGSCERQNCDKAVYFVIDVSVTVSKVLHTSSKVDEVNSYDLCITG